MLMASYIAAFPEAEDLLELKRGSMTSSPSYRCEIGRDGRMEEKVQEQLKYSSIIGIR